MFVTILRIQTLSGKGYARARISKKTSMSHVLDPVSPGVVASELETR